MARAPHNSRVILCAVCGGEAFRFSPVLWEKLISEWSLSQEETNYIDRQQGECCAACGANLRSIALAKAICSALGWKKTLSQSVTSFFARRVKLLEINEAGTLHHELRKLPKHVFARYPDIDMHRMPFPDGSFDIVTHSDTLEHVEDPVQALRECRRVLKPGGSLCFTVPVVVGRLSRDRVGLLKSYHGNPNKSSNDYVVYTEFGADVWIYPMQAGFSEIKITAVSFPAALAITATR